jgi:hypothetical protein
MASLDRSIVAHVPVFAGLSADDLDIILRDARSIRYPKESSVFDQGTEARLPRRSEPRSAGPAASSSRP